MKIEKVNDHQIRCTLTKEDLADREIKLSELAYGTDKAKDLFRDMMQQASFEFGFEAEDIPLMIEAIPLNADCIVLIITKVEDPDELDTRFSKFAPSVREDGGDLDEIMDSVVNGAGADDVLDLFKKITSAREAAASVAGNSSESNTESSSKKSSLNKTLKKKLADINPAMDLVRIYGFDSLHDLTALSHILANAYQGSNSLYKDPDGGYILSIAKSDHSPAEFNKVCNILSEYAVGLRTVPGSEAYLKEHFEIILHDQALQSLSRI
mgnify:FL=1